MSKSKTQRKAGEIMFDVNKVDEAIERLADSVCTNKDCDLSEMQVNAQMTTALATLITARAVIEV
ncbi:MAG: hypothetical protein NC213_08020 [Acetobacter sp.]|nr:hypothetical protein [Bacteroides sp.]MCM1341675.1 hypothetical protein [Acetobacter sp.]MCM1434276.1 hypothetical protein [Clostridiales bacterium]